MVGIAHVERAHAGVEPGDEGHLLVEDRRHALVRGMRAEAAAALAEVAARLRHGPARDHHRPVLDRDVGEPDHLPGLVAFVQDRLVDDHDDVARLALLVVGELRDRHLQHRESRMRAVPGRHDQAADLGARRLSGRRLGCALQQLLAIDDLHEAALVGAVAEIDAVALRPGRDRPVQVRRHGAGRARLLADQPEVADLHRLGRIAEVVELRHALGAPILRAADQEGDAGVAFPPALVRVAQAVEPRDQHRLGGIGDVPDLVRLAAEAAQHVDGGLVALGKDAAVAHPHHLRAAVLVLARRAGDVTQVFRRGRVGDVDDRGAVGLGLAGHRIERRRDVVGAAVMADIGDPALALLVDGRLVGAARLKVAPAEQLHVGGFGRVAHFLLLCGRAHRHEREADRQPYVPLHAFSPGYGPIIRLQPSGRPAVGIAEKLRRCVMDPDRTSPHRPDRTARPSAKTPDDPRRTEPREASL